MNATPLTCRIVDSKGVPGMLSIRPAYDSGSLSATSFRQALADSGFQSGDTVEIRLVERAA